MEEIYLKNMCRACMNENNETLVSVYDIATRIELCHSYAEMLMSCAAIQINEEDGLPQCICKQCMKLLINAFTFKQQCEQSDATLREISNNPGAEIEFIKEELPELPDHDPDFDSYAELENEFMSMHTTTEPEILINETANDFKMSDEFLEDNIILEDEEDAFHHEIKPKLIKARKEFKCNECDLSFRIKRQLITHKKVHIRRCFTCELCGKQFRSAHGLAYHTKIHKGIKNYVCNYESCGRRFRLKQALEKHMSIHMQEKNYLCSSCGKTYSTYDALHYHLKTHRGERPYLCMSCGKTFKQSCHLKSHMWVHNGIKPHVCHNCGKCYTSGHQLKKHVKKYCSTQIDEIQTNDSDSITILP